MTMGDVTATFGAPFAGVVLITAGAVSAGLAVVNEKLKFDAIVSGGSVVSLSVTSLAVTFTAHVVPAGNGELGVSVNVVAGDAVCVNSRVKPAGHSRLNAEADAVTLSLKVMTMVELTETL